MKLAVFGVGVYAFLIENHIESWGDLGKICWATVIGFKLAGKMTKNKTEEELVQNARLEEYRVLQQRITYALNSRVWGIASYSVIIAGLLAFASGNQSKNPYLVCMMLSIPYLWYTAYLERMRTRDAAYVQACIEPKVNGLKWHGSLNKWYYLIREERGFFRHIGRWRYILSLVGIYDIIVLFSYTMILRQPNSKWQVVLGLLFILLVLHGHLYINSILSSYDEYLSIFKSMSNDMHNKRQEGGEKLEKR